MPIFHLGIPVFVCFFFIKNSCNDESKVCLLFHFSSFLYWSVVDEWSVPVFLCKVSFSCFYTDILKMESVPVFPFKFSCFLYWTVANNWSVSFLFFILTCCIWLKCVFFFLFFIPTCCKWLKYACFLYWPVVNDRSVPVFPVVFVQFSGNHVLVG